MIKLRHRFLCGQLSRHVSKFGAHRSQHQSTVIKSSTVSSQPPIPPGHTKEFKEIQIPVPWGHVSGKWWGRTDIQPVLMLHGWQDNAGTFDTLVPLLHNESLLALEMVGHGKSSHYPLGQSYSYMDAVVDLRRVIRHFGWEKVSYIGHSMGSIIGYTYAGSFPDAVDKFVSIDDIRGALIPTLPSVGDQIRRVIDANLSFEKKVADVGSQPFYSYDDIVDLYSKASNGSIDREAVKVILRRGLVKSPDGTQYSFSRDPRWKVFSWGSLSEDNVYALAAQITCEILNIRSAKSFTSEPWAVTLYEKSLDMIEKSAKKFEYHIVDGTHHVHLRNPELIAPLINKFFETKDDDVLY